MTRTGVDNPWRDEDGPEPLPEWVAAGIPEGDAAVWRNWRFRISAAKAWRAAGVDDGLRAAQWSTAGATPASVDAWRAVRIEATEAVTWHEFGFTPAQAGQQKAAGRAPHDAYSATTTHPPSPRGSMSGRTRYQGPLQRFHEAGVQGDILFGYQRRQWVDDTALAWARAGIDAADALLWAELGLTPVEAGRLVEKNQTISGVIRDWWRAGIPYDEVADWIGAGLDPGEAAQQRARGITAEQAAALRALRDEDA